MANNSLPKAVPQVIGLGTKMDQGLITYGGELKITQITQADFLAQLNSLMSTESDFNAGRTARQMASDLFKASDVALTEWEQVTRNILAGRFGNRWSTMWAQAGFNNATTKVPGRIEERLALAASLAAFFTAHPEYEVKSMEVSAEQAKRLRDAAVAAQDAVSVADVALKTKGETRDTALATMLETMRKLVRVLYASMSVNDPRWLAFGLEIPSMNTTPGKPENLRVMVDDDGALVVQCDPVPLAMRYRWRMLVVGVETEYKLAARSVDPVGMITGVVAGQRVQIIVQAVNGSSQGVASDAVIFTMPAAESPSSREPATAPLAEVAIATNGNGSNGRNTQAAVSRRPALT